MEAIIYCPRKKLRPLGSLRGTESPELAGDDAEDPMPSYSPASGTGAGTWSQLLEVIRTASLLPRLEEEVKQCRASPSPRGMLPPPIELSGFL